MNFGFSFVVEKMDILGLLNSTGGGGGGGGEGESGRAGDVLNISVCVYVCVRERERSVRCVWSLVI